MCNWGLTIKFIPLKLVINYSHALKAYIAIRSYLTHINLASVLWDICTNSANQDQTPHLAASNQGLHCLLTEFSINIWEKIKIPPNTPKFGNGLVLLILVVMSIQLK